MAIKIGLAGKRKASLEEELQRILPLLIELGVKKIILFGSLSIGKVHRSSDIDLLIIKESSQKFLDRWDEFYKKLRPRYGIDLFIYTPQEFEEMKERSPFLRGALKKRKGVV